MSDPPMQRHRNRFAERNDFVYAALGVVSYHQKLMGSLAHPKDPTAEPDAPSRHPNDERLVDALLGLIRVLDTLQGVVLSWADRATPRAEPLGEGAFRSTLEFLR